MPTTGPALGPGGSRSIGPPALRVSSEPRASPRTRGRRVRLTIQCQGMQWASIDRPSRLRTWPGRNSFGRLEVSDYTTTQRGVVASNAMYETLIPQPPEPGLAVRAADLDNLFRRGRPGAHGPRWSRDPGAPVNRPPRWRWNLRRRSGIYLLDWLKGAACPSSTGKGVCCFSRFDVVGRLDAGSAGDQWGQPNGTPTGQRTRPTR